MWKGVLVLASVGLAQRNNRGNTEENGGKRDVQEKIREIRENRQNRDEKRAERLTRRLDRKDETVTDETMTGETVTPAVVTYATGVIQSVFYIMAGVETCFLKLSEELN